MLRSAQFYSNGKQLVVAMPITSMPEFKYLYDHSKNLKIKPALNVFIYGNGAAIMASVFSLETGKHLADVLSPYGPLDWSITVGTKFLSSTLSFPNYVNTKVRHFTISLLCVASLLHSLEYLKKT